MKKLTLSKKIQFVWEFHKLKVLVGLFVAVAILLPFWGLGLVDSYYKKISLMSFSTMPLYALIHGGIFVALYAWLLYGGGRFGSKLKKARVNAESTNIRWDDVIGLAPAKEEAKEVVALLKDHKKVRAIGGKGLRGLLLMGPPGCGKTYIAKAIATEADLPFLSVSGSEFVQVFVGTGPARVRSIFKQARELASYHGGCILFIDELDAVGRKRTDDFGMGGTTERNNTVNQILIEMDGIQEIKGEVTVIAATNADEGSLDSALLRPGRFDRKIFVDRPNLEDREELFNFYLNKVKFSSEIDVGRLARRAVWKTPAEIENIVKEAVLIASRNEREEISWNDLTDAIDRQDLGLKNHRKLTEQELKRVAYHEAGHAIAAYYLHPTNDVFKASIVGRKGTLGVVYHQPREDLVLHTADQIIADIKVSLAGYAAEKIKFGHTSDGILSDFSKATMLAKQMVWKLGMGKSGLLGDLEILTNANSAMGKSSSGTLTDQLNQEVQEILRESLSEVEALLRKESKLHDEFAKKLIEHQELDYDTIKLLCEEHGTGKPLQVSSANSRSNES